MDHKPNNHREPRGQSFADNVGVKATRKLKARRHGNHSVLLGFGMMGLVGWSVALPTLGGAILGIWLDRYYPGKHAWTLSLLVLGLAIGCMMAWHWIAKEHKAIDRDEEEKKDDE